MTPTKQNLQLAKRNLNIATQGYNMLEKKQKLHERELSKAKKIEKKARSQHEQAVISAEKPIANAIQELGADIIHIIKGEGNKTPPYELYEGTASLDEAFFAWQSVQECFQAWAMAEENLRQIDRQLHKTRKRANALDTLVIPRLANAIKNITIQLEERERDELVRARVAKESTHIYACAQTGGHPANFP